MTMSKLQRLLYLPHLFDKKEKSVLLILAIILAASGGAFLTRIYQRFTVPVPAIGGSYREGLLREPRAINPLYADANDTDRDIARLVFAGLFRYDGYGILKPDLAAGFAPNDLRTVYTVTLRDNLFWHDGETLDADDVVFTVHAIQNPLYKSPLRTNWLGVEASKRDLRTIDFTLKTPYAPFIENLTIGILPEHLWAEIPPDQAILHELNLRPVGAGPFRFKKLEQEKSGRILSYALERNPRYHLHGPYIANFSFSFFSTDAERTAAWHRGTIDGISPASTRDENTAVPGALFMTARMPRIFGIFFNQEKSAALKDPAVRRAIQLAIDPAVIARDSPDSMIPVTSFIPFARAAQNVASDAPDYDPEKARSILTAALWTDDDGDGILDRILKRGEKPTPLSLTLTTSETPELVAAAENISRVLRPLGISVIVQSLPYSELEATVIRPRNYDMLLFGQVYGYEPDPFAFWHSSQIRDPGLNIVRYANKNADVLLEQSRKTADLRERENILKKISAQLQNDLPAVMLAAQNFTYALPAKLRGVNISYLTLPADRFNTVNEWYFRTKRVFP